MEEHFEEIKMKAENSVKVSLQIDKDILSLAEKMCDKVGCSLDQLTELLYLAKAEKLTGVKTNE